MSPTTHEEGTPTNLPTTSGEVVVGAGEYVGYTVRETTGATSARIILYDNSGAAGGTILEEINLNAGESARDWYGRPGKFVQNGIYAQITGSIEGSVFT